MSALACCFWWFLAGLLLGWLLNWLLSKFMGKDGSSGSGSGGNSYNATGHATTAYSGAASGSGSVSGSMSGAANAAVGAAAGAVATGAAAVSGAAHHVMAGGADIAKAAAAGFKIRGNDDLEIIEGIGPKICELFHENGVKTFAQVSTSSVAAMNAILEKGGSRFKLANPSTWAEQARLCHENRWAELQVLQDKLSAGVDKS
jgi:predicted flap endonuclease-1-like 5' DNA nuclease